MAITLDGNSNVSLLFSSGGRVTGDFTNATLLSRAMFQTSTANSTTGIYALPSGTATAASWQATNAADPTNASKVLIATNGSTDCQLVSGRNGTGTYLPLTFYTNGSEQMRLDSSGNLGLGVTPSTWSSSGKAIQTPAYSLLGYSTTIMHLYQNGYLNASGNDTYVNTAAASLYRMSGAQHTWYNAPSGTAGNAISWTQAMTLDASGNLLVGTTSNNGIFTLSSGSNNANMGSFTCTNTSGPNYILSLQSNASAANTVAFIRAFNNTSTLCFNVGGSGNVTNTNNSYGAISDRSLKENIVDATPKLQDLLAVKIRNFNIKGDSAKQIGVVAQELEEVFPSMIEENADGLKGVKYSVFVPILVKAIQELAAELNELKAKVNA